MFGIENHYALIGSLIFTISIPAIIYALTRSDKGFGDFSVGITYMDFYSAIILIVPMVAASSYLFMAFGFGIFENAGEIVHWLRYYEWALSTPLLILGALVLTQDSKLMIKGMFADFLMIMAGFLAEVAPTPELRLAAFSVSSLFFLYLMYIVGIKASEKMEDSVEQLQRLFSKLRVITVGLWLVYPLIWVLGPDIAGLLQGDNLFISYMVLDLVSKIGYAYFIIDGVGSVDSGSSGKWL